MWRSSATASAALPFARMRVPSPALVASSSSRRRGGRVRCRRREPAVPLLRDTAPGGAPRDDDRRLVATRVPRRRSTSCGSCARATGGSTDASHTGRIVVHRDVASDVASVLRRLYAARFPIRRMVPVDAYGGERLPLDRGGQHVRLQLPPGRGHESLVGARVRPRDRPQPDREPVRLLRRHQLPPREPAVSPPLAVQTGHGRRGRRGRARVRRGRLVVGRALVAASRTTSTSPRAVGDRRRRAPRRGRRSWRRARSGSRRASHRPGRPRSCSVRTSSRGRSSCSCSGRSRSSGGSSGGRSSLGLALTTAALVVDTRGRREVGPRLRDGVRRAPGRPRGARRGRRRPRGGRRPRLRRRPRPDDAAERLRHDRRPPLARRALATQNGAAGYPDCACAPYVNAYPPHGELGVLATMTLGGADRYVTLVQAGAYVALALGVVGVARALGLARGEALLGGLLVATLPVIALQSSTAQNDLVVASFLVAAGRLPPAGRPGGAVARGRRDGARGRDEGHGGDRDPAPRRGRARRAPRPSSGGSPGGRPRRLGGRRVLVRRQLASGGKLGRRVPVRGDRPRARADGCARAPLGDPVRRAPGWRRARPLAVRRRSGGRPRSACSSP